MLNINKTSRRFYKQTEKHKHAEFSQFKKSIFVLANLSACSEWVPLPCSWTQWLKLRCLYASRFFKLVFLEFVQWIFLLSWVSLCTALKTGNCCWLIIFSIFSCVCSEKIWTIGGQAPTQLGFNSFICHTVSFHLAEQCVHIRSCFLPCVCTFLFVYIKLSVASWLSLTPVSVSTSNVSRSSR